MQEVYVDISNLLRVNFLTGIQRVVRNVLMVLLEIDPARYQLLYAKDASSYCLVNKARFVEKYRDGNTQLKLDDLLLSEAKLVNEFQAGDIFFDLDSAWNMPMKRTSLLPLLKKQGVRTAVYIYDTLPVNYPQFFIQNTLHGYLEYFGAYCQNADLIITSTQTVLDEVHSLQKRMNLAETEGGFSWLGSDFEKGRYGEEEIDQTVANKLKGKKYLLCVGTIEPRKNHAFLLDAFEHELFEKDISLVCVGRVGWNVESLVARVEKSSYLDKQLFMLQGINDATLEKLYSNALAVVAPTYDEGFGLPVTEAFERGIPVIASDRPVLREVGGELADYFELNNEPEFSAMVMKYADDPAYLQRKREALANYKSVTWREVGEKIHVLLEKLKIETLQVRTGITQMVYLTARPDAIAQTLAYVDRFMPFIKEIVLCCPDSLEQKMTACYKGRFKLTVLTDSKILDGSPLPADHQTRNTFLRAMAMKRKEIQDVFIMSDDDARPMREISEEFFVSDGCYQGYYCYDIDQWTGMTNRPTSYDKGMYRTAAFLNENGLPRKQYSSHMPQVIDKTVYLAMLDQYKDIEQMGLDEWTIYFNYLQCRYPDSFVPRVYETMCWPAYGTDWEMLYIPTRFSFENFYPNLYGQTGYFRGMSPALTDDIVCENEKKVRIYREQVEHYEGYRKFFASYKQQYYSRTGEWPEFGVIIRNRSIQIIHPQYLVLPQNGFVYLPFETTDLNDRGMNADIHYRIMTGRNDLLLEWKDRKINTKGYKLPIWAGGLCGHHVLEFVVDYGDMTRTESMPLIVTDQELNSTDI